MNKMMTIEANPLDCYLRVDRIPHIWCAGCGIGPATGCLVRAIDRAELNPDKVSVVSGIGCSGRMAGYIKLDSFHTTHGRALPFATGLKLANPELTAVVFSGDGDLAAIGGNHLIHSARRNIDMTVICINNFNYGMTGGQMGPTTPLDARSTTSPYGNYEYPFNLPYLVAASGATYVARWTVLHLRELERSIAEALTKPGFSFIEVLSPCPTVYGRMNKQPRGLDEMRSYQEKSVIRDGADPRDVELAMNGPIVVGKFVDIERPTLWDCYRQVLERAGKRKKDKARVD
jgi:2-oxoglutarate ferredoxin oxidoreductase subunit beta